MSSTQSDIQQMETPSPTTRPPANEAYKEAIFRSRVMFFDSGEHAFIGDLVRLAGLQAEPKPFRTKNHFPLSFGDVIALAGDFFSILDPISDGATAKQRRERFNKAFQTLYDADSKEITLIQTGFKGEIERVNQAIKEGRPASSAYTKEYVEWLDNWYAVATNLRYVALAAYNWDHFGPHAVDCYRIGHELALETAAAGDLTRGYFIDGFAGHFLTDLFSSGHLRTPRREAYESGRGGGTILGGLSSRFMHDEDGTLGLTVRDASGSAWIAYGDARLRDADDTENMKRALAALQSSVDEVYASHKAGQKKPAGDDAYAALKKIPQLSALHKDDLNQHAPLFIAPSSKSVQVRVDQNDLFRYEWKDFLTWKGESDWLNKHYSARIELRFPTARILALASPDEQNRMLSYYQANSLLEMAAQTAGQGFTYLGNNPVPLSGACGYTREKDPVQPSYHFVYADSKGSLTELFGYWGQTTLHTNRLTQSTNAPPASSGPAGYAFESDVSQHVNYRSGDDHIWELWQKETQWFKRDLTTALAGCPQATGEPFGFAWEADPAGPSQHVLFTSKQDGSIQVLSCRIGANWERTDLTAVSNSPIPSGRVTGFGWNRKGAPSQHVVFRTTDGLVYLLTNREKPWLSFGFPVSPRSVSTPLAGYSGDELLIVYPGTDARIYLLRCRPNGDRWSYTTENVLLTGAPRCASIASLLALSSGELHIFYFDFRGHLLELFRPAGGQWAFYDITSYAGAAPL